MSLNTLYLAITTGLNSLLDDIVRGDTATAQADYNSLSPRFDQLFAIANPNGSPCDNSGSGSQLTEDEAIQTIQAIQSTLSVVSLDVTSGNTAGALESSCTARSDFFNSGLHEYVFGSGQASGTGA